LLPPYSFSLAPSRPHPHLHSFPTRRSSDLVGIALVAEVARELECAPDELRASLYADLPERQRLLAFERIAPRQLLDLYNLAQAQDRKSTRLNSSHSQISYAVFCLKKKK